MEIFGAKVLRVLHRREHGAIAFAIAAGVTDGEHAAAFRQGFSDQRQLSSLARALGYSVYGEYLERVMSERVF